MKNTHNTLILLFSLVHLLLVPLLVPPIPPLPQDSLFILVLLFLPPNIQPLVLLLVKCVFVSDFSCDCPTYWEFDPVYIDGCQDAKQKIILPKTLVNFSKTLVKLTLETCSFGVHTSY